MWEINQKLYQHYTQLLHARVLVPGLVKHTKLQSTAFWAFKELFIIL